LVEHFHEFTPTACALASLSLPHYSPLSFTEMTDATLLPRPFCGHPPSSKGNDLNRKTTNRKQKTQGGALELTRLHNGGNRLSELRRENAPTASALHFCGGLPYATPTTKPALAERPFLPAEKMKRGGNTGGGE
jgi:hypothetical protein